MNVSNLPLTRGRRWLIAVLWPSFVLAIIGVGLLFSAVDPILVDAFISFHRHSLQPVWTSMILARVKVLATPSARELKRRGPSGWLCT